MSKSYLSTIALLSIFFDESRNVRGDWEYDTDPNPKYKPGDSKAGLYEDIEANGLQTPLWVSKLDTARRKAIHATTGVWYDWICVRGHRRGRVLKRLALVHPKRFDLIPCQCFEGLSEADEIGLLVDQVNVKGLSDWGIYLAIKRLSLTGLSEEAIGTKIGRSRGYVQSKLRVARMPQYVEDAFRAKAEGKPTVNLTEPNLVELAKARKTDEDNGIRDTETGGPEFQALWGRLVESGVVKTPDPKTRTRNQLLDMCSVVKDPILVGILKYAAGDTIDLNGPIHQLTTLREKALAWETHLNSLPMAEPEPTEATEATPAEPEPTPAEATEATPEPTEATEATPAEPEPTPAEPEPTEATDTATVPFETEPVKVNKRNGKRHRNG